MRHRAWPAVLIAACAALSALGGPIPTAHAAFGDHALRPGAHGRDVRVLQRWLTLVGFRVRVDGAYGPRTTAAVRRYERASALRVDGRVSRAQARGLRGRAYAARAAQRTAAPAEATAPAAGERATLAPDGRTAIAPASAPAPVVAAIAAANRITDKPYIYGGGHGRFEDRGYDCSGSVSYALHGAGLLDVPRDSTGLGSWGERGRGTWISVYANKGHAYMMIAGLRFDTSGDGGSGPRWRPEARSSQGFAVRHPAGL
jgi:hypothetical protein